ncbi:MAG: hypothetical protein OSJ36_11345 [Odoribacter sp.]|nr:hypothetical protein [Odoribacter sp.]
MEHKYSTKFKGNLNFPFAKVGLRVFRSLFNAETYCTTHNLDVDSAIEYGDSEELKVKVQEIAEVQKAILCGVLEALDGIKEQNDVRLERVLRDREHAEKIRDILTDYYKNRVHEIIHEGSGLYEARKIVSDMLEELEGIRL